MYDNNIIKVVTNEGSDDMIMWFVVASRTKIDFERRRNCGSRASGRKSSFEKAVTRDLKFEGTLSILDPYHHQFGVSRTMA
jgi:hypothetical protein